MTKIDWYRRTTWTESDRDEFNSKLNRARDKEQYLRIQAFHLAEVRQWEPAIELLQRIVREFPNSLQLSMVHSQLADAYGSTGRTGEALEAFVASLDAQRMNPSIQTNAWLDYAAFVVLNQIESHYEKVVSVLSEFCTPSSLSFPALRYKYFACWALLAEHDGNMMVAKSNAELAIHARNQSHSGLRYHPTIGLVNQSDDPFRDRLHRIESYQH